MEFPSFAGRPGLRVRWGSERGAAPRRLAVRPVVRGGRTPLVCLALLAALAGTAAAQAVTVIAFDLNGESVHVVHMPPGFSDDDAIVHFHHANIVHLGGSLTTDGYPLVDLGRNGSIDGIIETVSRFVDSPEDSRFVPRRGPVIGTAELRVYRRMLTEVRDRVRQLARSGATEAAVVEARPTAAFDARWGQGPVTPAQFVRMVYRSRPIS